VKQFTSARWLSVRLGGRNLQGMLYWLLCAVFVAVAIHTHAVASLTLPAPSNDEAFFVWQSHAFARSNSFVAPELDPSRPILLLPFVYQGAVGIAFKALGTSIEMARHVSMFFFLIAFACLAIMVRRHAAPLVALALVMAVLMNVKFVMMANSVRMEPLLLAALCLALLLAQRERIWLALAVLSVTPMIHPNGVLYLVPVTVYAVLSGALRREAPGRVAVVVFIVSGLVWAAHGIYVLRYWDGFVYDSALRFGEMAVGTGKEGMARIRSWRYLGLGFAAVVLGVIGAKCGARTQYLLLFALGAWLHSHLRFEEPYFAFSDLSFLLLSLAVLQIVATVLKTDRSAGDRQADGLATLRAGLVRGGSAIAMGLTALALLGVHWRYYAFGSPVGYFNNQEWSGMRTASSGAYFGEEDRRVLQGVLKSFDPTQSIAVEVYPWSDGLLIADLQDERVRFQVPYLDPVLRPKEQWAWGYGPTEAAVPDLYIIRVSRFQPPYLHDRPGLMLDRALERPGVGKPAIVHSRDSTEVWYAIPGKEK
jgi:hypothetical protein